MARHSILVIDDDPIIVYQLRTLLEQWGYLVEVAGSGKDALEWFKTFTPEVVLLDWNMPGMSGIDLLRILRKFPERNKMFIIMVSGKLLTEDIVVGFEAGANDYMIKPYSMEELRARIANGIRTVTQYSRDAVATVRMREDIRQLDALSFQLSSMVSDNSSVYPVSKAIRDLVMTLTKDLRTAGLD